jgi:molecular chaperone GrpE
MKGRQEQAPGVRKAGGDDSGRGAGEASPAPGRGIPSVGDASSAGEREAAGPAEPAAPAPAEGERDVPEAKQGPREGAVAEETPPREREAEAVEHDIDELVGKARERDEYLSLAQRTQADFENYRKRASRDLSAAEARGVAKLARELLPALDNLHLALAAAEGDRSAGDPRQLAEGIRLVAAELSAALARVGIEAYSPEGERFDPALHEAMAQQPVEGAESGTIVEVYQQGYRADGIVLRPARVVVAA